MIEVTQEQMYAEACRALGDSIVRQNLMAGELQRMASEQEQPVVPQPVQPDEG